MCRRTGFLLCALLALPLSAGAQLTVQLGMERDTLLLYEPIPVVITIRNYSGRTINLGGPDRAPWLDFLITDEAGATMAALGHPPGPEPASIPPGRTVSRVVDLLPEYDLRQRGTYTVRAVVSDDGTRTLSPPLKFVILNGREVWKQTVGLPVATGQTNEEYRTYSLITLRVGRSDLLYVGVQDNARKLVYGMILLGEFLPVGEPDVRIDTEGGAHVLYRTGPRSHSYAEISSSGEILKRAVYSDLLSAPHLVVGDDGSVAVAGGEQTYPRLERVIASAETNAPPAPPEKPRKKKWWWPFGSAKPSTPATNSSP